MARNARRKDLKIVLGTVLAIPVTEETWALGQVLFPGTTFYLSVTAEQHRDPLQATDIGFHGVKLFSWTNDAEVYRGRWKNLGLAGLPTVMPIFPEYKLESAGDMHVSSFDGKKSRAFVHGHDDQLNYKTSRSPLLVEDAVKAACGVAEWRSHFDKLLSP